MEKIILEGCVETIDAALEMEKAGVDRIELCSALSNGGVTPSYGSIKIAKERLSIPIHVIIRPRGGDYIYSDLEMEIMKRDIEFCKVNGIDGVVFGALTEDREVNKSMCKELLEVARPMKVTFHRAYDEAADPFEAVEAIVELGFDKLLTAGHKASAIEGSGLLADLVKKYGDQITIMPGSGINFNNVDDLHGIIGANEYHGSKIVKL